MLMGKKIFIIIFLLFINSFVSSNEMITLGLLEMPPFMSKDLEGYGIKPTIVTNSFKNSNINVKYIFFPHKRAYFMAQHGHIDGIVGWVYSRERTKDFFYSDVILSSPLVFFHLKKNNFIWNNYNDLKGKKIGIIGKNFYGEDFHNALEKNIFKTITAYKTLSIFHLLLRKNIDLAPYNLISGTYLIKKNLSPLQYPLITHNKKPLKISEYHLLLSKRKDLNNELIKLFNKGFKKYKKSNNYKNLLNKYNLK